MRLLETIIEREDFFEFQGKRYSRRTTYIMFEDTFKYEWFKEGEIGFNTIKDENESKMLEAAYTKEELKHKRYDLDIDEMIYHEGKRLLRSYTNWPTEKITWMTRDRQMEKDLIKQTKEEDPNTKLRTNIWMSVPESNSRELETRYEETFKK